MRLRVLVVAAGLLWPVSVFSETAIDLGAKGLDLNVTQFVDGNDLFRLCSDHGHAGAQGECLGYVVGLADAFRVANAIKANGFAWPSTCPPKDLAPDQARDIMVQWLTAHPATRHNAATHEALAALLAAFPCK
jgi:hypothetical protein